MQFKKIILLIILIHLGKNLSAIVKYDEGGVIIMGVQFLQDRENTKDYYYIPTYPRLSMKDDKTLEFLCMKYVGANQETSGGLFHALIQFTLPDSILNVLQKKLSQKVPGARIAGPVPMMQPQQADGENFQPSFEIVSAVLNNREGKDAFTRTLVASGFAPLTPGSKAAVAALLNQQGATILWNSLTGPTSDISVSVHGYYEAAIKAYNATVTANMSTVYQHLSRFKNKQEGYKKVQIRQALDSLAQTGGIKVEVFDRTQTAGIPAKDMESILNTVTAKLTELMFDNKTGWSQTPQKVNAMEGIDVPGKQTKQERGTFGEIADAAGDIMLSNATQGISGLLFPKKDKYNNPQYVTDDEYILKDIKDISQHSFYLNLTKTTTIKVPIHSSGNIGGIYQEMGTDPRYFRIVNMNDPDFQKREIHFQIDGEFVDAFDDMINFVTVNFRKKYSNGQQDVTEQLFFNAKDMKEGVNLKNVSYPRLGLQSSDWLDFEYQLTWSLKGNTKTIHYPSDESEWIKSNSPAISLSLPFKKEFVEIDGNRQLFAGNNIVSANVIFATTLAGEKKVVKRAILRTGDTESTFKTSMYRDPDQSIVYQTSWYSNEGEKKDELKVFDSGYLNLVPPKK